MALDGSAQFGVPQETHKNAAHFNGGNSEKSNVEWFSIVLRISCGLPLEGHEMFMFMSKV